MAQKFGGRKEFAAALKRLPKAAKEAGAKAVVESGIELSSLQKQLVAVDKGDLQKSITVTPPGERTPPYSQPGGSRVARPLQAIVTAGNTKVRYAHLVEYGTAPHINGGWAAGTLNPGYKPEPYFWPAYRSLKTRIRRRISRKINKAIKAEYSK